MRRVLVGLLALAIGLLGGQLTGLSVASAATLDGGPGGPILVVSSASNPFGGYLAEILRTEGFDEFQTADISAVSSTTLAGYDVVLLGQMPLTAGQVQMFTDWVNGGGNLIAMRPDKQLAGLLGLTDAGSTLSDGYIKVDTSAPPGEGIVADTIQFHGTADRYTTSGAQTVATLYSDATTATSSPAVTLRSVGSRGGQAAAFTYDLARSVVYTRQGNPAWAGQERDGISPIRSDDLFFGGSGPDWVDFNKIQIPQADEQQRLLANLMTSMEYDRAPLPRFWYFPHDYKAVVIMTGDDHDTGNTVPRFAQYEADSPAGCSVADWQCVRATSYMENDTPVDPATADAYDAKGFELSLHVNTNCGDYTATDLDSSYYTPQLAAFRQQFPDLPAPTTERTHCVPWSDWATQPKVQVAHGIRLDTDYYYWPSSWVQDRPGLFTGSGMIQRFADTDGSLIDDYQAVTQWTDESTDTYGYFDPTWATTLLDNAVGSRGWYGAFTANMHMDFASHAGSDAIVAAAQQRGVPVIAARQMLTWLDQRNASSFSHLTWSGGTLSFDISPAAGVHGLRAMLPTTSPAGPDTFVSLTRDGNPVPVTRTTIKGVDYAFFDAAAGTYIASYKTDTTPPTITNLQANVASATSATVTWSTDELADSRVDYGTSPTTLDTHQSDPTATLSHRVALPGLSPGTTYYYRVTSTVQSPTPNSSTSPAPGDPAASFTTPPTVPGAPTGLAATGGDSTVSLSWSPPSNNGGAAVGGYAIYRSTTAGAQGSKVGTTAGTSYTDAGLTNGTAYFYRITAVNGAGEGPASTEASATPQASGTPKIATVPGAPGGLSATGGNGQVGLTWSAPSSNGGSPITGYDIYRSTAGSRASLIHTTSGTSYTDTGLANGTAYDYRVKAVNAVGEGPASTQASATPHAAFQPGLTAPTATMREPREWFGTSSTTPLAWTGTDDSSRIASYDVRVQMSSESGWTSRWRYPTRLHGRTATRSWYGPLRPGWQYCFEVRAHDVAGNVSRYSPPRCVTRALDDRGLAALTRGWSRPKGVPGYYESTFTSTNRHNARLATSGAVAARRIALLATTCPTCGAVRLYISGHYVGTISLRDASRHRDKWVIVPAFAYREGVLAIRTANSHKLVRIDAVAISR